MIVENKVFFVFYEVEDVCVGAGEFVFSLLAKGIMPDYPVSKVQAEFMTDDSDICSVIISNCDVEGTVRLQDFLACSHPVFSPGEIFILFEPVFVVVVLIAYIERGVGEYQIGEGFSGIFQYLNAVAANNRVGQFFHVRYDIQSVSDCKAKLKDRQVVLFPMVRELS